VLWISNHDECDYEIIWVPVDILWHDDETKYDDAIWCFYDVVKLFMGINVDVVMKSFVSVWMYWFDDALSIGVSLCFMMKWSCNMIYMESCIVESILGIHVSWPVLFNDWYLMTSGLISNIPLIIKILKDGGITR